MEIKKLHIVALDVPYPANYGGAIDMYYRLKALHELGFQITLHVFEYGRGKSDILSNFAKVIYYSRKKSVFHVFSPRPFIVQSRISKRLLDNLRQDDAPIVLEGLHTTWCLEHPEIQQRMTFVRMHNIEHEYYRGLQKNSSFFKRYFFRLEAKKLKKYQHILRFCTHVLAIKESDAAEFRKLHASVHILPASVPDVHGAFTPVKRYALFHGKLSVAENDAAARWIIAALRNVLDPTFPLVIAGHQPGKKLRDVCRKENIKLLANPSETEMHQLIQEAQIHVLHTSVASGIKLKLIACVRSSGHILLNDKMVRGTALEQFCTIAEDAKSYKLNFLGLQQSTLSPQDFARRDAFVEEGFNTKRNCELFVKLLENEN